MKRLALILCLLAAPLAAVQPSEVLDDPVLEERARALSEGLRCPVCRNESIDESNATLSADLRVLLRERLVAGDTDEEALQYLVDRYGEYILLNPPAQGANLVLWLAAPLMLLLGGGIAFSAVRSRGNAAPEATLSEAEKQELEKILKS